MSVFVLPRRWRRRALPAALAAALALAGPARGHEVLHEVQRGRAVAVRARFADGQPMAGAAWEVYAPADDRTPWLTGRTDPQGWLAFVPAGPGRWRVRVVEATGHGLDLAVEEPAPGAAAPAPGARPPFLLRSALGVGAVAAVFAALWLFQRRRPEGP